MVIVERLCACTQYKAAAGQGFGLDESVDAAFMLLALTKVMMQS